MQKKFYFLSPVEVVKVTSQNLDEVAEWCGGKVAQTESRRVTGRMDSYVWVPTPKGTNISWAFPGMFITKRLVITVKGELRATLAVFRRDYFEKNYFESPKDAVDLTWEREAAERNKPAKNPPVVVNVHVADAMSDAIDKVKADVERLAKAAGLDLELDVDEVLVDFDKATKHLTSEKKKGAASQRSGWSDRGQEGEKAPIPTDPKLTITDKGDRVTDVSPTIFIRPEDLVPSSLPDREAIQAELEETEKELAQQDADEPSDDDVITG